MCPFFWTRNMLRLSRVLRLRIKKMYLLVYWFIKITSGVKYCELIVFNQLEYNRKNMNIFFALMMKKYIIYARISNELLYSV